MNILDTIIAQKRLEVAGRKQQKGIADLEKGPFFRKETLSLKKFIQDDTRTGIIAEFKRKSPSKGIINDRATVEEVTTAYARHGASGISVLTDTEFFGGSLDDLLAARVNKVPLLRKDFTIDDYQLVEAKAYGADVILLIAACLSPAEVRSLARVARGLGLEVLLELHDESELGHVCEEVDLVGVNNRNLKTFSVDLEHSVRLAEQIGSGYVKVAESGISQVANIRYLKQYGFQGFLIGENFMKETNPGEAFKNFVAELKEVEA
ncbi:MAG TPA: indole-3-glycerol phosphate synthase TrpC [Chitinophagaceae bacterium]